MHRPSLRWLEIAALVQILGRGIVTALGYNVHIGPVYAHFNLAVFTVDCRLMAVVAQRVLRTRLLGNFGVDEVSEFLS